MRLLPFLHRISNRTRRERGRPGSRKSRRSLSLESLETRTLMAGTWTKLANPIPSGDGAGTMILLSDGTVMAQGGSDSESKDWYKLTPDSTGSYTNGTWSTLQSSSVGRLFYASDLLPDGRVYVAGGEDATDKDNSISGEIYNPATNQWSNIANYPKSVVADGISETLPGGRNLQGSPYTGNLHIYNPATNQWSNGPTLPTATRAARRAGSSCPTGAPWTTRSRTAAKTANRLVLGATDAQDQSVSAGSVPVALQSNGGNNGIVAELGPGFLLPNGTVFWVGASGHTALYTPPSGNNTTGTWTKGPDILDNNGNLLGGFNGPGAVEPNGKVLFAAGPIDGVNNAPPTTNSNMTRPRTRSPR